MPSMASSHGRSGYRGGCRCSVCKAAEARRKREARRHGPRIASVVPMPQAEKPNPENVTVPTEPGDIERAVRLQIGNSAKADSSPAYASMAIKLAQQIDGDDNAPPQLFAKLDTALSRLDSSNRKRKAGPRLASVIAMSAATRKAAQ
jgi:hypothetical protein